LATWTVWVAPKTLKPAEAAEIVGMSEAELRDVNRIPPSMLVQAGSSLVVPRPEQTLVDVPGHLAENGHLALAPDTHGFRRVTFRAGRHGDSVPAVAQRYRVPAEHVAMWNHVGVDAKFRGGQNIVVMVAAKAPQSRKVAASTKPPNLAAKR
jgi:membrane-bound lytic murein transglycosylase D